MTDYTDQLAAAEQKYGLPSGILQGQASVESGGNPKAVSGKGAVGLMQFTPATAKAYGVDPTDPASSIDGAARFMADNLKATKGNVPEALRLYQGGPNRAGWGKENAAYAGKVLTAMPGDTGTAAKFGIVLTDDNDPHVQAAGYGLHGADDNEVQAEVDRLNAMNGAPASGDMVTDPKTGKKVPAINPETKGAFFGWGESEEGHRYPMYGPPGSTPDKPSDSMLSNLGAGAKQGLEDVVSSLDPAAGWIESHIPGVASAGKALGLPSVADAAQKHETDQAVFNGTSGKSLAGTIGRIGGNIVGTAPMLMGGEALLGSGLEAAGAPGAAEFLTGNAGRAVAANPLTGAAAVPGNLLMRGASLSAQGAVTGAGGAALTGQNPLTGAAGGAVLGPVGGVLGAGVRKVAQSIAPTISPAVARLAQTAGNMGIPIRPSQISGSPFVKGMDSVLGKVPGSGMADANDVQRGAFMRAVGKTFGADSEALTPEVMSKAKTDIGGTLNAVADRTRIHADDQLMNDLGQIEHEAPQALTESEAKPLGLQINNILSKIKPDGTIDGATYQALTRKGAPLDVAESNHDSNIAHYAGEIRKALDDALERSAHPDDLAALKAARLAYKNMKTVEPLVSKSADGTFSPALLNNRVSTSFKNRAYTGAGDLGDLAAIGQRFIKASPSSGTAENEKLFGILALGGKLGVGAVGAALGHSAGLDLLGTGVAGAGGLAGTSAVSRIATKALSSPAYRNRLISASLNANQSSIPSALSGYYLPAATATANRLLQGSGVVPKR